jgi:hypothetical protein
MIKVTIEADYDYEILNFIQSLATLESRSKVQACTDIYDNCSFAGTKHDLCDSPVCNPDMAEAARGL